MHLRSTLPARVKILSILNIMYIWIEKASGSFLDKCEERDSDILAVLTPKTAIIKNSMVLPRCHRHNGLNPAERRKTLIDGNDQI